MYSKHINARMRSTSSHNNFCNGLFFLLTIQNVLIHIISSSAPDYPPSTTERPFTVIWNVPTERCSGLGVDLNVSRYDVMTNRHEAGWRGDVITIVYAEFGLYPYVADNGSVINGGIPQVKK